MRSLWLQDAALVAMRSEVVAETTKLRNQQLEDARQDLQQQVQQEVTPTARLCVSQLVLDGGPGFAKCTMPHCTMELCFLADNSFGAF